MKYNTTYLLIFFIYNYNVYIISFTNLHMYSLYNITRGFLLVEMSFNENTPIILLELNKKQLLNMH